MKPVVPSNAPRTVDELAIEWSSLVTSSTLMTENESRYLTSLARYCNNGGMPNGIVAIRFTFVASAAIDRLLDGVHFRFAGTSAARLLARSSLATHLHRFDADPVALEARIEKATFVHLSPFFLEGTLADGGAKAVQPSAQGTSTASS